MKNSDEKNYRSLIHFSSKALFLGIGISKILIDTKESTIFSLILGTIIGTIIMTILNKINYQNVKGIKKLIISLLIYILFLIALAEFVNLISSIYLMDTNRFIIVLPLLIVILYINSKELTIHYKISKILLTISFSFFIVSLIALIPNIDYLNYFPLYNVNIKKILFASLEFAIFSTAPNIIFGGLNYEFKDKNKKIIKSYIFSNLTLILVFLLAQGILGINLIEFFKYPEYIILKKINMLDFINNIENILSFLWIFTMFMFLSICSKQLYDISYSTFNKKYIYPIFLFISVFFISNYLFDNIKYLLYLYKYLWLILLIIIIIYIITNIKSFKKK